MCAACLHEVCSLCSTFVDIRVFCVACAARERERGARRSIAGAIAAIVALGALAYLGWRTTRQPTTTQALAATPDAGALPPEALPLVEALRAEPCNRVKSYELAVTLLRAGAMGETVRRVDTFLQRCEDNDEMRAIKAEALRGLSAWDAAIAEETRLIERLPGAPTHWYWRGSCRASQGVLDGAIEDFRQAFALAPRAMDVPVALADMLERTGQRCEAIAPLEQALQFHPDAANALEVRARVAGLYARSECSGLAGEGRAVIRFAPGAGVITTAARVNQVEAPRFVVDTGASYVAISADLARRLGVDYGTWSSVTLQTAGGLRRGRYGRLDEVSVRGVTARRVRAVVVDELGDIDGLLGMSFLSRFDMSLDPDRGRLSLSARTRPGGAGASASRSLADRPPPLPPPRPSR